MKARGMHTLMTGTQRFEAKYLEVLQDDGARGGWLRGVEAGHCPRDNLSITMLHGLLETTVLLMGEEYK